MILVHINYVNAKCDYAKSLLKNEKLATELYIFTCFFDPDTIRGSKPLEKINMLRVNLDDLEFFIEASKRVSSEREVKVESFIEGLVRFMELEEEAGKSYGEILSEFEEVES